jgi:Tfp pilus assembly protein PilF
MIDQKRIETHICDGHARRCTILQAAIWTVCTLAIWQLVGCSSPINGSPLNALGGSTASSTSGASQATWPTGEQLPPKQAAQACLATAKELHAHGDAREAILLFERARQLDPRQREVSRFLAVLYDQQGNDTKALAEYRKALDVAPRDADLLDDFGYFYYQRCDWKQAEEYFRKAIAQAPEHERAWVNLGLALGEQDRYPESFEAFSKVLGPAAAHSNLGVILAAHQRPTEAEAEFKQALRLKPDLPQPRAFLAHLEKPANTAEIQTAGHLE